MIKEIRYSGMTTLPDDYSCPDGSLDMVVGMSSDNESQGLMPILPERVILEMSDDSRVLAIHETSAYKNYIYYDQRQNTLRYRNDRSHNDEYIGDIDESNIIDIATIGNTLMILTQNGIHYYLHKDNRYLDLGTKIPDIPISFGLVSQRRRHTEIGEISFDTLNSGRSSRSEGSLFGEFSENNKRRISDQVMAKVNKAISEDAHAKGRFVYPFFVRYAYRLYDGSLVHHSPPVLMITSTATMPQVSVVLPRDIPENNYNGHTSTAGTGVDFDKGTAYMNMPTFKLDYAIADATYNLKKQLNNWSDIISSVDIFISEPIYSYDQSGLCQGFSKTLSNAWGIYSIEGEQSAYEVREHSMYNSSDNDRRTIFVRLPEKDKNSMTKEIKSRSRFYLVKSLRISELSTSRTVIEMDKSVIPTLSTRELMSDDYGTHSKLIPQGAFVYNNRVNIYGLRKDITCEINARSFATHFDTTSVFKAYVHLKKEGRDIVLPLSGRMRGGESARYIFYPDPDAYQISLSVDEKEDPTNLPGTFGYPLERHEHLNGAVYFNGFDPSGGIDVGFYPPEISPTEERIIQIPNQIYTSEVNNPFFFPLLGINAVGNGRIIGLATTAKALSQGQLGQFPLYAFTTDGVWALEVSDKGTYKSRQPIARDVCLYKESITPIDNAVLFISARGIMLLSGSESRCISGELDGVWSNATSNRKQKEISDAFLRQVSEEFKEHIQDMRNMGDRPITTDLSSGRWRMIYDYTRQRIIVYQISSTELQGPPTYAYVYGLRSKKWTMMQTNVASSIPSYPEALAFTHDKKIVDLSSTIVNNNEGSIVGLKGVLITRPIKLDMPSVLKTITGVYQRGHFKHGHVKSILYGSQDLERWNLISSSVHHQIHRIHGTGYRYFRIVLLCDLDEGESILGCSIEFTPKQTNRMR